MQEVVYLLIGAVLVIALSLKHDKVKRLEAQLNEVRSKRLKAGMKLIYARDGIRKVSGTEMDALMDGTHPYTQDLP